MYRAFAFPTERLSAVGRVRELQHIISSPDVIPRLSNEKPSAIFRLRESYTPSNAGSNSQTIFSTQATADTSTLILGFALETIDDVERQVTSLPSKPTMDLTKDPVVLAERVAQNLINYLAGFVPSTGANGDNMVPMHVVTRWFETFRTKLQSRGIGFLNPQD